MTCSQISQQGDCTTMITGNTAEEMSMNAMKHIEESHPEMAAQIKAMSKEDMDKWMADFQQRFDAAPAM